jgi:hypothetical protein
VYEVAYLDNVKCNEPIDLDLSSAEALLLNGTEISNDMYKVLNIMIDKHGRKIKLYPFNGFKEKGVSSNDTYTYYNGANNPPTVVEGSFIEMFGLHFDNDVTIKRLIRLLNMDTVESFAIYTDNPNMLKFVFDKTDGKKYQGIPADMFYLFKKLLNK